MPEAEYKLSFSFHSVPTPPSLLRIPPPPPPTCMYRQAHREKAMNKHANEESTILFLKTLILWARTFTEWDLIRRSACKQDMAGKGWNPRLSISRSAEGVFSYHASLTQGRHWQTSWAPSRPLSRAEHASSDCSHVAVTGLLPASSPELSRQPLCCLCLCWSSSISWPCSIGENFIFKWLLNISSRTISNKYQV